MKRIYVKFMKMLFNLSVIAATVAVNTTCARRYYQEELDGQFDVLKKLNNKKV